MTLSATDAPTVRCVAHRGTPGGLVPENTAASALVALRSGADAIEVDVSVTTDGAVLAFHDGLEREQLGIVENITTLTAAQVGQVPYMRGQLAGRPVHVQSLATVLRALRGSGAEVHVDRAWPWWAHVLPVLQGLDMDDQVVIKTPASTQHLAALQAMVPRFTVAAICASIDDVARALAAPLPVRIIELVSRGCDDIHDADLIGRVHAAGALAMVNAEVVGSPMWLGHDDEVSVLDHPDKGWGMLIDTGFDYVQTDFPWLFTAYRDTRRREK
ncbi:glycerophosphodiester phosphodiesterase family protein [Propionibacteriaceae bacterium G57]|uniref:glycerophosphodiester phosphodiesterase family protein n=1 Tax=Aestuariimicrobium sp. G57 TaxID=3418485 RepID=UPI003DA721CB